MHYRRTTDSVIIWLSRLPRQQCRRQKFPMEKIGAHSMVKFTARKSGRVVDSFAQIEKVALVFPTEERCIPDECTFGTKMQGVTRREVLTIEIV
jgi:hypothetical protein